ncbi:MULTISPECIES: hypothetical protein [Pseudomonas]|uniref:hypothetical protein n=1 Tax=Pseudomonas TaxID=286 RepID=UPI000F020450|nr:MULTISPECIES: hypothetical protein [Pseudomonas]MBD8615433.1 hypothetical protein [Pseudomonas putida]MBD8681914.1 hypothetical protein [Pseudomonas sp. CFBP 13719]
MFAHSLLENLFNEYQSQTFCPDVLPEGARLAEEWLMGFVDQDHPHKVALDELVALGDNENETRLRFAFSLAFCAPCEYTGRIIVAFAEYLAREGRMIGVWIGELTKDLEPHLQVDVLKAFDALPDGSFYKIARGIYSVREKDVSLAAIATDNLKVFRCAMPDDTQSQREEALKLMAWFPYDMNRLIFKDYILRSGDLFNLVLFRTGDLYAQMLREYTDGIEFQFWNQASPALLPKIGLQLQAPDLDQYPAVHKTPEFTQALNSDSTSLVRAIFLFRQDSILMKLENQKYFAEVTAAFIASGVSPEQIIAQGVLGKNEKTTTLFSALDMLGVMTQRHQQFYVHAYTAYLAQHSVEHILNACPNNKALLAVYNITGNRAFIQEGDEKVRDLAMAADLGL